MRNWLQQDGSDSSYLFSTLGRNLGATLVADQDAEDLSEPELWHKGRAAVGWAGSKPVKAEEPISWDETDNGQNEIFSSAYKINGKGLKPEWNLVPHWETALLLFQSHTTIQLPGESFGAICWNPCWLWHEWSQVGWIEGDHRDEQGAKSPTVKKYEVSQALSLACWVSLSSHFLSLGCRPLSFQ